MTPQSISCIKWNGNTLEKVIPMSRIHWNTIPISQRIGLLDRKLRVVSENTDTEEQIELCPGCKKMAA